MSSLGPKRFDAFLSYNSQDRGRRRGAGASGSRARAGAVPGREGAGPGPGVPAGHSRQGPRSTAGPAWCSSGRAAWARGRWKSCRSPSTGGCATVTSTSSRSCCRGPSGRGGATWRTSSSCINASWVEFLKTLDEEQVFQRLVWGITGQKPTEAVVPWMRGSAPIAGWRRSARTTPGSSSAART